jgi:cytochrome c553
MDQTRSIVFSARSTCNPRVCFPILPSATDRAHSDSDRCACAYEQRLSHRVLAHKLARFHLEPSSHSRATLLASRHRSRLYHHPLPPGVTARAAAAVAAARQAHRLSRTFASPSRPHTQPNSSTCLAHPRAMSADGEHELATQLYAIAAGARGRGVSEPVESGLSHARRDPRLRCAPASPPRSPRTR